MSNTDNALSQIQHWYKSQCDGDWEHTFGITIDTSDSPGWLVTIDMEDTGIEGCAMSTFEQGTYGREDWIICKVEDKKFRAAGGPLKLDDILSKFLELTRREVPIR